MYCNAKYMKKYGKYTSFWILVIKMAAIFKKILVIILVNILKNGGHIYKVGSFKNC